MMQVLVVVLLAVPFAYMAYDIALDLAKRSYGFYNAKAKPVLVTFVNMIIK